MKYLLFLFLIVLSLNSRAQYIRQVSDTQYSTTAKDPQIGTLTKSNGVIYPLYISVRGRIYYWKISTTGNKYKVYTRHPYYQKY